MVYIYTALESPLIKRKVYESMDAIEHFSLKKAIECLLT